MKHPLRAKERNIEPSAEEPSIEPREIIPPSSVDKPNITWAGNPDVADYTTKKWNGIEFKAGEATSIAHLPSNMQLAMINAAKLNPDLYTVVVKE